MATNMCLYLHHALMYHTADKHTHAHTQSGATELRMLCTFQLFLFVSHYTASVASITEAIYSLMDP